MTEQHISDFPRLVVKSGGDFSALPRLPVRNPNARASFRRVDFLLFSLQIIFYNPKNLLIYMLLNPPSA